MSNKKELTVAEIKETLDAFGIEYSSNLKKKELLALLDEHTEDGPVNEEPVKKYIVVYDWKDLEDNNTIYIKGDLYPKTKLKPSKERIEQLSTTNNKIGKVLIKERS